MIMAQKGSLEPHGTVRTRVGELIAAEKARGNSDKVTYRALAETLGMSKTTITAWANSTVKQYDADKLALFCEFFGVGIEDVLVYERE
jgi:transcriptional regulator with XRE-family HTH domain